VLKQTFDDAFFYLFLSALNYEQRVIKGCGGGKSAMIWRKKMRVLF
jgi:hypothetical protein